MIVLVTQMNKNKTIYVTMCHTVVFFSAFRGCYGSGSIGGDSGSRL